MRTLFTHKPILLAAILLSVVVASAMGLTSQSIWNTVLDQTNSRLRVKVETYDSTLGTAVYTDESIANQLLDTTDNAIAIALTGAIDSTSSGIVINEDSADQDFRVESDANANMLFVDGGNSRVGFGTSSPDVQFENVVTTAYTHVPVSVAKYTVESSGTPATGIGLIQEWEVETSAANNEVLGKMEVVADDATSTSEDGAIQFYTMTAGATATEKFSIGSTEMAINDGSADYDFRVESNGKTDAIAVDGGNDTVTFGGGVLHEYTNVNAASYTVLTGDHTIGVSYTDTGLTEIFIPAALAVAGREFYIFDEGVNADNYSIVVHPTGKELNEAAVGFITTAGDGKRLISNGTNWFWH